MAAWLQSHEKEEEEEEEFNLAIGKRPRRGKLNTSFTAKVDSAADQMKVAPIEMWTLG